MSVPSRRARLAALAFAQMASAGALVAMVLDGPMLAGGVLAALLAALIKGLLARAGASAYALMMLFAWGGGVLLVANHPLAEQAGHALFHVGAAKAHKFERQRGIKRRPGLAQPVVQAVLGPADGGLAAAGQPVSHLIGLGQQFVVVDRQGHQTDALGLFAADRFAQHQVVLGLGHAAQQRPADGRVVAGGDAELELDLRALVTKDVHGRVVEDRKSVV